MQEQVYALPLDLHIPPFSQGLLSHTIKKNNYIYGFNLNFKYFIRNIDFI
jgi:hypothetical protein